MKLTCKKALALPALLLFVITLRGQTYAPPVGQPGTSAISKDSSVFVNWAVSCAVHRGFQDISNTALGYASVGDSSMATGKAESNGVLSLGDGGSATCAFSQLIKNGPGPDFAVFENGFDDTFLELAFVDVSSDGVHFVRFPSHSLSDTLTQTGSFGATDATKINNLAGKYRGGYGTPFDLQELAGTPNLDVDRIAYVRITDVVGALNNAYATRDSYNRKINDPWPTAFASGGFDLDAVGVIHENLGTGLAEYKAEAGVLISPNPLSRDARLNISSTGSIQQVSITDLSGKVLLRSDQTQIDCSGLAPGLYIVTIETEKGNLARKLEVY